MSITQDIGETGAELVEETRPAAYAEDQTGYAWTRFLASLSMLLDAIAEVARTRDGQEGWTQLADPQRCPPAWLKVLAQWAGVRRPDAMTEAELRELIGPHAPGMWRGTRPAMIAAIRRFMPAFLPSEALIYFEERADGDPYALRVFTYTFVDHDPAQVRAALEAAKPAGLTLTYEVRPGQAWFMLRDREGSWADVRNDYATWNDVHLDEPIGGP